jgi:DNA-directed RNA polymerase specialized sigma24 family protein
MGKCKLTPDRNTSRRRSLAPFNALHEMSQLGIRHAQGKLRIARNGRLLPTDAIEHALSRANEELARNPARFVSREHLLNFLRQRAFWTAVINRRGRRGHCKSLSDRADEVATPHHSSASAERAWPVEAVEILLACLRRMPARMRQLLERHYFDGLTDADAGVHLYGTVATPNALGQRARKERLRALEQLRRLLVARGVVPGV